MSKRQNGNREAKKPKQAPKPAPPAAGIASSPLAQSVTCLLYTSPSPRD